MSAHDKQIFCPLRNGEMRITVSGYYCEDKSCHGVKKPEPRDELWLDTVRQRIGEIDRTIDALESQRDSLQAILSRAKAIAILDEATTSGT